jgi:NADH-quinone oxidoreductase subunit C
MAWAEEVAEAFDSGLAEGGTAHEEGFGPLTVTVPSQSWPQALTLARDRLGCAFFDWLSAVDELEQGFTVVCHLVRLPGGAVEHLLVQTRLPREDPRLASVVGVYAGAAWHERETREMFGIAFTEPPPVDASADAPADASAAGTGGSPGESPTDPGVGHLLLPEEFEGFPLRKDFVLASRVVKPFPGAKEPGESDAGGGSPSRRRTRPPGVPDPESWGPREPGSEAPDPLAHAQPGQARPRRTPRARSKGAEQPEQAEQPGQEGQQGQAGQQEGQQGQRETGPEGSDG